MMRHRNLKYGLVVALLVAAGRFIFRAGVPVPCLTSQANAQPSGLNRTRCDWDRLPWGQPSPSFSNIQIRVTCLC